MANPQREDGHIDIANEIAEAFRRIRIPGECWQILWCIFRQTWGYRIPGTTDKKKFDKPALSQFMEWSGIKRPNVVRSLLILITHKIVIKKNNGEYGFNKNYDEWIPFKGHSGIKNDNTIKVVSKMITTGIKNDNAVIKNDNEVVSKMIHSKENTKETSTKETIQKKVSPADETLKIPKTKPKSKAVSNLALNHNLGKSTRSALIQQIVNYWNTIAPCPNPIYSPAYDIPKIVGLSKQRIEHLNARLKEKVFVENWKKIINKISCSEFCRGANDRHWRIDFSWIIKSDENYIKVLEGKYDSPPDTTYAVENAIQKRADEDFKRLDEKKKKEEQEFAKLSKNEQEKVKTQEHIIQEKLYFQMAFIEYLKENDARIPKKDAMFWKGFVNLLGNPQKADCSWQELYEKYKKSFREPEYDFIKNIQPGELTNKIAKAKEMVWRR